MSESHKDMKDFLDSVAPQSNLRVEEKLECGFVRLRIREAERRQAQQDIRCVEDIVIELLRNSRDAGAHHIFVATNKQDNIRTITVLDDGVGIPQSMHAKIFEARVTSKLDSVHSDHWGIHGRGMALYAIKEQAQQAYVASSLPGLGTALVVRINTDKVPEKRDQSTRPLYRVLKPDSFDAQSKIQMSQEPTSDFELVGPHNIIRTCCDFALRESKNCEVYLGTPTEIIATLYTLVSKLGDVQDFLFADSLDSLPIIDRFFAASDSHELMDVAHHCALEVSERNIHRILSGQVKPVKSLCTYFHKTHQNTSPTIDIYDTKRSVHLTPEDKTMFTRNLSSTFDKLAKKYYIGLVREPSIVMRNNKIIVTFDYDESDFV